MEAMLLDDDSIADCAVVVRETENGENALVAYVVASEAFSPDRPCEHLGARLPDAPLPTAFVPISSLPLTEDGEVDEDALGRLPVIDEVLTERWERRLNAHPGVDQVAAVVVEEKAHAARPLHLDDLLPERTAPVVRGIAVTPRESSTRANGASGPPAFADGGALDIPGDAPQTLTQALIRSATERADSGVTYVAYDGSEWSESYAGLLDRARRILAGLQRRGLGPGDRALLQIDALEDHYAAFWACILGGIAAVPVAVPPSYRERNGVVEKLFGAWQLLGQPPVLASNELVEPVCGLRSLFPMDPLTVLGMDELVDNPPTDRVHDSRPGDLAFLPLSSGSTGVPKCVQELHSSVVAHAHAVRQADGYDPADITLNWMPVDHVGALIMWHLRDTYLGCRQVQVKTDLVLADPLKWLDLLEAHRVSSTWSPNFGYKLVADELAKAPPDRRWDLSRMRFFLNGGEQVTLAVTADFLKRVAPFGVSEDAMQPAYGGAETCTRITANNGFGLRTGARRFLKSSLDGRLKATDRADASTVAFIDVGSAIPGVQLRIVDNDHELLPEGVIGRLQIKGPVVTPGYLGNDAANREAFAEDGWLSLGDLGFILDGRLTLTGREKETIVVRGANLYCYEIEDAVNAVEGVEPTFAAACAVADSATGTEGFAIFFVPRAGAEEPLADVVRAVRARVAASLGATPTHVVPVAAEDFPKTTSGKIQRAQLGQALEAGRFRETLRALDVELENANTLPDWFYRRTWRQRAKGTATRQPFIEGATVVFRDRSAQGSVLAERLARDRALIEVEAGASFERIDQTRFRVAPGSPDDYERLLAALAEDGICVDEVVHLWTYGGAKRVLDLSTLREAQERGAYSLLFLIQALAGHLSEDRPVRALVVSSHAQPVLSSDGVACEHGPLLGLVRTATEEAPWLGCRHVDLEGADPKLDAEAVLEELGTVRADQEVAYRDGRRWVPRLERADLPRRETRPLPFERGGVYLLTGGLGGVGREVAEYLLENYEANLLLVGRTSLLGADAGRGEIDPDALDDSAAAYGALEQLGGEVSYRSADIADPDRLRAVVAEAETRWGRRLDGILHLAGVFEERLLTEETRATFEASLRPKVEATWVLHELASERADCAFVGFSSVNGLLGGFSAGAYAAANSFLDSFTHYRRRVGLPSTCFAWSLWDGVGMARDYPLEKQRLSRARGFLPISASQGLTSFLAGLHRNEPHLLVGLDATRPNIGRHVEQPAEGTRTLRAYFTASNGRPVTAGLDALEVRDRFGTPCACELVPVPELPATEAGAIDLTGVTRADEPGHEDASYLAPRTPAEDELAAIWAEVLELDRVGVEDHFFELGGYSLLVPRVMSRLNQRFGIELPMRALFDAPTVAGLALLVTQARAEADADIDELLAEVEQTELEPTPRGSPDRQ